MSRKLSIKEIKERSLHTYDLTLISNHYIDNKHKLEWIDNKTGIKFYRSWGDINSGRISPINKNKKLSIDDIRHIALNKYGLVLTSHTYANNKCKLDWIDSKTGTSFSRSWNSITKGSITPRKVNDYMGDKNSIESYKDLGYQYNKTKLQYMSAPRQGSKRLLIIEHPLLTEPWVTTMANFLKCASSYLTKSGVSYGENVIYSILYHNSIQFKYQYPVTTSNRLHIFDIYLQDYNLFIEYDGVQHYKPISVWGGEKALEERKVRDQEKDEYVANSGATILRIPYTADTETAIVQYISNVVPYIKSADYALTLNNKIKEVAEYYDNHSVQDTQLFYNISRSTVNRYYKKMYNLPKSKRHKVKDNIDGFKKSN